MPAQIGYAKGVPMGGDLQGAPAGKAPTFLVGALKDPIGANLDRIQIVKGWLDAKGELHEKVYDVAWVGRPQARPEDRQAPLGRQHRRRRQRDLDEHDRRARADRACGRTRASTPRQRAFYYARVIEIPTPRWTAYDAKRFGIKPLPGTRMTITERAYTSPIWYTPN